MFLFCFFELVNSSNAWWFKLCNETFLKFIYSEKATKFCEISTLLLSVCTVDKSKVEILQNFVAFSEYMNFKNVIPSLHCFICTTCLFYTWYIILVSSLPCCYCAPTAFLSYAYEGFVKSTWAIGTMIVNYFYCPTNSISILHISEVECLFW